MQGSSRRFGITDDLRPLFAEAWFDVILSAAKDPRICGALAVHRRLSLSRNGLFFRLLGTFAVFLAFCSLPSWSQTGGTPTTAVSACSFDVASIRPGHREQPTRVREEGDGTIFRATSIAPVWLLYNAFQVRDHQQVSGYPKWVEEELYDILAKTPEESAATQCLSDGVREASVLRELLVQRFGLKYHVEQRMIPVYALDLAQGGPKLKISRPDAADRAKFPEGQYWFLPPATLRLRDSSTAKLAAILTNVVGKAVDDRTGLKERYDLELKWDQWTPPSHQIVQTTDSLDNEPSDSPPILSALREQLGLKLTPARILLPVYVIDRIVRPTPN